MFAALLDQQDGTTRPLLVKAGANVAKLRKDLDTAIEKLPTVQGTPGDVHVSQDLNRLLNVTDKLAQQRKDDYIPTELFVLASFEDRHTLAKLLKDAGASKAAIEKAIDQIRGGEAVNDPQAEEKRGALEKYTIDLTARALERQARSGHRPRRRDPPHHPGARAPHQEQPGAHRRARRGQDRNCRRPRAAHHQRRSAREASRASASWRSTWAR